MIKVVFTAHALGKFAFFKRHKVTITKRQVADAVRNGRVIDTSELPKIQSAGPYDRDHSLVVIHRPEGNQHIVITFWIAEKRRYESNIQ